MWGQRAQGEVARAEQVLLKARADAERVREERMRANAAFKAAQTLLEEREEGGGVVRARGGQAELDDLARRRRPFFL